MRPHAGNQRDLARRGAAVLAVIAGVLLSALITPSLCVADTITVGPSGDYSTICPAVGAASSGDTVVVLPGTYSGPDNRGIDFGGTDIALVSSDGAAVTIIDCGGEDRAFRIHSGERPEALIRGFTVRNGRAPFGGGAYFIYASPTIEDCTFDGCSAEFSGGGLRASMGSPAITSCTFTDCAAVDEGGGISLHEASAWITACVLSGNSATDGGGVSCFGPCAPALSACTVSGNSAARGAGIYLTGCSPSIEDCAINDNEATGDGGGVYGDLPELIMTGCELSANTTAVSGGGLYVQGAVGPNLTTCSFSENVADVRGGAVYVDQTSTCSMRDCSFTANSSLAGNNPPGEPSGGGGALFVFYVPSGLIEDCEFHGNTSAYRGGAIDLTSGGHIDLIARCVFSQNIADVGGAVATRNAYTDLADCVFLDNSAGGGGAVYDQPNTVTRCTFMGNLAEWGGALYLRSVASVVTSCTFVGNAAGEGGSIWLSGASGVVSECVLAFGGGGGAIEDYGALRNPSSSTVVTRCVAYGNVGGDDLAGDDKDNVVADPLFCGFYEGDYSLCENSPCLPGNNSWGLLVGAHDQGCPPCDTPVEHTSWGSIKAMFR